MTPTDKPRTPPPGGLDDPDDENTSPTGEVSLRVASPTPGRAPARPRETGDPFIGKVLDHRYRLVQLVARGGMGRVYRAEQAPLNRIVAVKILESAEGQDDEFRDRFIREAGACARLAHPNTIRIFDYGNTWDDIHYIAMEFLEGRNLHTVIRGEAPLAPSRVVHIAIQVCASLREAHQLGLIHRDLKPSNVMLMGPPGEPEFVKVLDFGLVKELRGESELTRADAVVGSPSYMSPEQIRAAPVDQRSDIYALGVLLYACLTGRTPFSGATTVNVLMAHLSTPPPPLTVANPDVRVGPVLEWTVQTCLAKEAEDRFANVDELRRALVLAGEEAQGRPVALPSLVDGRVRSAEDGPAGGTPSRVARPTGLGSEAPSGSSPSQTSMGSSQRVRPPSRLPWVLALGALGGGAMMLLLVVVWLAMNPPSGWGSGSGPPLPTAEASPAPSPADAPGAVAPATEDAPATADAPATPEARSAPPAEPSRGARASTASSAARPPADPPRAASGADAPPPAIEVGTSTPPASSAASSPATSAATSPASPGTTSPPSAPEGSTRPSTDLRDPWKDK